MIEAVKAMLDPTAKQARMLTEHAGVARFAYNQALSHVLDQLNNGQKPEYSYYGLRKWWNQNKNTLAVGADERVWWSRNSKEAYNTGLENLSRALRNHADSKHGKRRGKHIGFPRFKSRSRCVSSIHFTTGYRLVPDDSHAIRLPRIGRMHRMENVMRRIGHAHVLRIIVTRSADRWYASIGIEHETSPIRARCKRTSVGIDMGVKNLATLSDGTAIPNPHPFKRVEKRLARAQRMLSRRKKGSHRRDKARLYVARLHQRIYQLRQDALHKITTEPTRAYAHISIEDLNVAEMIRNHHLTKSLRDASFGEFRRQLEYKSIKNECTLHVVDRFYPSSKKCSDCRMVKAKLSQ